MKSLRARLIAGFILLILLVWASASIAAWFQTSKSINKLFDTWQLMFAKRLSVLDMKMLQAAPELGRSKRMVPHHRGKLDVDTLAFAIFTADGKMILHDGDNGKYLQFENYYRDGFSEGRLYGDDDPWRIIWLTSADKKYHIAVGQELEYRQETIWNLVLSHLIPWCIALPLMLLLLIWLVNKSLSPLHHLAQQLHQRSPDDACDLPVEKLPLEIMPLVNALNKLFHRIGEFIARERRFTSDAAHELRSPLAALKVQTEVALLAHEDTVARHHALNNLGYGIERASRLIDQLLTLSRLDSLNELDDVQDISLDVLLQNCIMDIWHQAQREDIDISLTVQQVPSPRRGQPLLLDLMIRNILDNAVRYSARHSKVQVTLNANALTITDNGPGIEDDHLPRIGERFFRPPGQAKTGSGLGLSIVQRIASLHDMRAGFGNVTPHGFQVRISWSS